MFVIIKKHGMVKQFVRGLKYLGPEDRNFNRVISDISFVRVQRETTLTFSAFSIQTGWPNLQADLSLLSPYTSAIG